MLHHIRQDYHSEGLEIHDMDANPFNQFHNWFQDVLKADIPDPNAMTLSTCTVDGRPSSRIVLLKDYTEDGFSFYTNYESRKGREMADNPFVSLNFLWKKLHRQVRIEGQVEKLPMEESLAYFQSRPRGSQVGAWASPQSGFIDSRESLDKRVGEVQERFAGQEVLPLPPFWGGYLVVPDVIEFWQGQPSRLHDRFLYELQGDGGWEISRLAP
ncbi:MAG: pyridoxamine 5'-phosphate oxidase [Saprospiraceae bacterium]